MSDDDVEAEVECFDETYEIVRFFEDSSKERVVLLHGLTLAQAKEYCSTEETRGDGWFDGFRQE